MQTSGQQTYIDKNIACPGDTITAEISMLSTDIFNNKLKEGLTFEFREGDRIIGTGKILTILNKELIAL
jgi:translation elongation factor EF-Tu-like GTPase